MLTGKLLTFAIWLICLLNYPESTTACECGVGNEDTIDFRIINGHETLPHAFPWSVYLTYNSKMFCGGAIISSKFVLTAGHCVYGLQKGKMAVFAGAHQIDENPGVKYTVDTITLHPNFTRYRDYDDNDIALIRINDVFKYNSAVGPVCLPIPGNYVKRDAIIAGWGITESKKTSRVLLSSRVRILHDDVCKRAKAIGSLFKSKENICAYGYKTDTCQGDSGSSMLYEIRPFKYQTLGVVSWGQGCAPSGIPGVYTNVLHYVPWILAKTKNSYYCKK